MSLMVQGQMNGYLPRSAPTATDGHRYIVTRRDRHLTSHYPFRDARDEEAEHESDDRPPAGELVKLVHGLRVRSQLPIAGATVPGEAYDLEIVATDQLPSPCPTGPLVLSFDASDGESVRAARDEDGSTLVSFTDQYRFRISSDHRRIEMAVQAPGDPAMAMVLLQGWVMAMTLILRGMTVLHATAVAFGDRCVALLGDSGMGKTTIAALLLREQGILVSDDVLRVEQIAADGGPGRWVAHSGLTALRLRDAAADLAGELPASWRDRSPDGRLVLGFEGPGTNPVGLAAVLVPLPSRTARQLEIEWLRPAMAAVELNEYERVYEWQTTGPARQLFEATAELATTVPVGLMTVPWGPPWPPALRDDLLSSIPAVD